MKRYATAVAVMLLGLGMAGSADERDIKGLDGTYKAIAVTRDGKDEPEEVIATMTARIAGDDIAFSVRDKTFPAKLKLDPKAKPAHADISPTEGPEKGKTFLGIYKVEKGELILAFAEKGDRPTEFKGSGDVRLIRLKRDEKK